MEGVVNVCMGTIAKRTSKPVGGIDSRFQKHTPCPPLSLLRSRAQSRLSLFNPNPYYPVSLFSIPKPDLLGALDALMPIPRPMCPNVVLHPTVGTLQSKLHRHPIDIVMCTAVLYSIMQYMI